MGFVWQGLRRGFSDNTIRQLLKEYQTHLDVPASHLTSLKIKDLNLSNYSLSKSLLICCKNMKDRTAEKYEICSLEKLIE